MRKLLGMSKFVVVMVLFNMLTMVLTMEGKQAQSLDDLTGFFIVTLFMVVLFGIPIYFIFFGKKDSA